MTAKEIEDIPDMLGQMLYIFNLQGEKGLPNYAAWLKGQ